jgi:hypothetical protein
MQAFGQSTR